MQHLNAEFMLGAAGPDQFLKGGNPQVCFAGRSNVGKSSLLNSILRRKKLAFISSTPGKTQEINFYNVSDKWVFADLPGYGYAAAGKDKRKQWSKLNFEYLESSEDLKLVCALVDIRHDPTSKDLAFIEWLENHERKYIIILTKSDKIPKKKIAVRKKQLDDFLVNSGFCLEVFPYSAVQGDGREQLLAIIKRECSSK